MLKISSRSGFTLLEIVVVVTLISIFALVIFSEFNEARMQARDESRKASLEGVQVALELYKVQYGYYPAEGCGSNHPLTPSDTPTSADWDGNSDWTGDGPHSNTWANNSACEEYIAGLAPEFISELPADPKDEMKDNLGYLYQTNSEGSAYKVLVYDSVELQTVSDFENDFSRCPWDTGSTPCTAASLEENVYAIYSAGAEDW